MDWLGEVYIVALINSVDYSKHRIKWWIQVESKVLIKS